MHNNRLVFATACAGMLLFGIVMLSLGTVNSYLAARFSLDPLTIGSLAALLPFGIMAGSLVFGPVVDRYGYKIPFFSSSLLIFGGFELIAFSSSFGLMQIAFFLIGMGGGVLNGGTNALVADISGEGKGARLSLLGVFFGIGALGMPAVTGAFLAHYSYEAIISAIGGLVVFPVLMIAFIRFPVPKQPQGTPLAASLALLGDRTLLFLSFVLFFQSAAEGMSNNWTALYLQQVAGVGAEQSLLALTVLAVSLTVARLLFGVLSKRMAETAIVRFCLVAALLGAVLLWSSPVFAVALAAMILLGSGFSVIFPFVLGRIGGKYVTLSGTAFGIALTIALLGNMFLNYLVGIVSQTYGIARYPVVLLISIFAVALLLGLAHWKESSHQRSME